MVLNSRSIFWYTTLNILLLATEYYFQHIVRNQNNMTLTIVSTFQSSHYVYFLSWLCLFSWYKYVVIWNGKIKTMNQSVHASMEASSTLEDIWYMPWLVNHLQSAKTFDVDIIIPITLNYYYSWRCHQYHFCRSQYLKFSIPCFVIRYDAMFSGRGTSAIYQLPWHFPFQLV